MTPNASIRSLRILAIAAAAPCAAIGAPASADPVTNTIAPAEQAQTGRTPRARVNPNQRICAYEETTGTRLTRLVCRTRAEWRQLGDVPGE